MKKSYYVIGGIIMIALGAFWLLRVAGVIPPEFTLFFEGWWPLFIIVPSFLALISSRDKSLPAIGLVVGVMLLLAAQDVISWQLFGKLIVPALVIVIGIFLLISGLSSGRRRAAAWDTIPPDGEIAATFSSRTADFAGRDFTGASLTAVFGSVTLDLTRAMIAPDAVIRVYTVFGSIDVLLPENTRAAFRVAPVFGGFGDKRAVKPAKDAPAVNVDGTAMFGSVNVK